MSKRKTIRNLSKINNKSSNCITPGYFNPLINYKTKEEKVDKKNINLINKNKDHFYHMNPTELYKYKPLLKRTKINYNSSQITSIPGNVNKDNVKDRKKSGKKLFEFHNKESDIRSRNQCGNKIKYSFNTTYNLLNKNKKKYEFNAPTISYNDMKNIKN